MITFDDEKFTATRGGVTIRFKPNIHKKPLMFNLLVTLSDYHPWPVRDIFYAVYGSHADGGPDWADTCIRVMKFALAKRIGVLGLQFANAGYGFMQIEPIDHSTPATAVPRAIPHIAATTNTA